MLNKEEATALLQLINRVSVNGQEAETVVFLKNKLKSISEPEEAPIEETPKKK
jgi:hypothetical protein